MVMVRIFQESMLMFLACPVYVGRVLLLFSPSLHLRIVLMRLDRVSKA